jgi:allophanate hydrolase
MTIEGLLDDYRAGRRKVREVIADARAEVRRADSRNVWITVLDDAALEPYLARLEGLDPGALPLYGVPFAIKDNIDLAGVPTTAGCPEYAYVPERSAFVVQRLLDAGAIPLGKTNLDQFATGLVGVRSPYGVPRNPFDPAYIPGGSSSGSAVAVAAGLCDFALGTDTAGSGRVPAAFNNLVGLKPTRGLLSTRAWSRPAARWIASRSSRARGRCCARARTSWRCLIPTTRSAASRLPCSGSRARPARVGRAEVPTSSSSSATRRRNAVRAAVDRLRALGGEPVEIDFVPFPRGGASAVRGALGGRALCGDPGLSSMPDRSAVRVTREDHRGRPCFTAQWMPSRRSTGSRPAPTRPSSCGTISTCVLTPTAGTIPTVAAVQADPLRVNSDLGYLHELHEPAGPLRGGGAVGLSRGRIAVRRYVVCARVP